MFGLIDLLTCGLVLFVGCGWVLFVWWFVLFCFCFCCGLEVSCTLIVF